MDTQWYRLPELLREASLEAVEIAPDGHRATLRVGNLVDEEEGEGSSLSIEIGGLAALLLAYDTPSPEVRPSEFGLEPQEKVGELAPWPIVNEPMDLSVNLEQDLEEAELAAEVDVRVGSLEAASSAKWRLGLWFTPEVPVLLIVAGDTISLLGEDGPVDLGARLEDVAAWWEAWETQTTTEEMIALSPTDDEAPERSDPQKAPDAPAFAVPKEDIPEALLTPLRDWFEGLKEADWKRRASASIRPGQSLEERAHREKNDHQLFQSVGYARAIDAWWREGRRAFVRVRGLEYEPPSEGQSERARETVWDFDLREQDGQFHLHRYEQGWPRHGSAPKKPRSEKPWMDDWTQTPVEE